MPSIIENSNDNRDRTARIYDQFYDTTVSVNANDFDVVFSYFISVSQNATIAGNFTSNLFRISQQSGINVLELLQQLKSTGGDKLKMNQVMAYYLNSFKNNTALYGASVVPRPNQLAAINVVQ